MVSLYKTEVSRFLAQSVSILLFADFNWYTSTDGIFQPVLKVRASAVDTGLTEKSLKRCHWLSPGGVGSAWATIERQLASKTT